MSDCEVLDLVDLVSDDEEDAAPAPSSTADTLGIAADMFEPENDEAVYAANRGNPGVARAPADGDGSDVDSDADSDDDLLELLETPSYAARVAARQAALSGHSMAALDAGASRGATPSVRTPSSASKGAAASLRSGSAAVVTADDALRGGLPEQPDIDIDAFLPGMNGTQMAPMDGQMYEGPATVPEDGNMSGEQLRELMDLNQKSADATAELPTPPEMTVVLLKHQRRALSWMVGREADDKPATHPRGGILADDQGFGKTLTTISLILTERPPKDPETGLSPAWGNLIVAPTSILHQWAHEFSERIDEHSRPKVCIYHGPNRPRDPYTLVKYDVVITSYGTLVQEYPRILSKENEVVLKRRKKGPLFKLKWFRCILDEAQAIKNHRSETFAACIELKADRRWSLSGTPLQNSLDDMYSQFMYIKYYIVSGYKDWKRRWKKPLEGTGMRLEKERLFQRFQALLGVVLLRRAKHDKIDGQPVIPLPERNVQIMEIDFSPIELAFYQAQEGRAVSRMNDLYESNMNNYAYVLVVLLRLRQACAHPALCDWGGESHFDFSDELLDQVESRMKSRSMFNTLPEPVRERLFVELGPDNPNTQTCPICLDLIEDDKEGIITKCGHIFCSSDFAQWNETHDSCPSCRCPLGDVLDTMNIDGVRKEVHALYRAKKRKEGKLEVKAKTEVVAKPENEPLQLLMGSSSHRSKRRAVEEDVEVKPSKRARTPEGTPSSVDGKSDVKALWGATPSPTDVEARAKTSKTSTKITALLKSLKEVFATTDDKALVFSQWTRMLNLIEIPLREEGIEFVRLDGSMGLDERETAVRTFTKRSKCRVFLISLKAGSTGLNLIAANRVYIMDPWWNPSQEDQAIDRCHRIGQKKAVHVVKFKIPATVEERIFVLQDKKKELAAGALGVEGLQTVGRRRLSMRELMSLFSDMADNVANRAETAEDDVVASMAQNVLHMVHEARDM